MVSGLLVPVIGTLVCKKPSSRAAMLSMILGGTTTLGLIISEIELPFGLDANFYGICLSAITFIVIQNSHKPNDA
jgi:SSS family solute:Na+ symporter